ncbi:MAG: hypothetical protein ABI273_22335 [Lacunisphaera sp.]
MKAICPRLLAALLGLSLTSWAGAAEPVARPASRPAAIGEPSFEPLIATTTKLNATGDAELHQLIAQLANLKAKRSALRQRLQTARAPDERTAISNGLEVIDEQIRRINDRIGVLQAGETPAPARPVGAVKVAKPHQAALPASSVHLVPPEQIAAAGKQLANSPSITESAARSSAQALLRSTRQPVTNADVEQLAIMVMAQANKEADADLKVQMTAMKQSSAKKKVARDAVGQVQNKKDAKDSTNDLSEEQQRSLQMGQERSDRISQLLSNMQKRQSDTSAAIIQNQK